MNKAFYFLIPQQFNYSPYLIDNFLMKKLHGSHGYGVLLVKETHVAATRYRLG